MDKAPFIIKNVQILAEIFRIKNSMSSAITSDIFLNGNEIITKLRNKMTFFNYIISVKTYINYNQLHKAFSIYFISLYG